MTDATAPKNPKPGKGKPTTAKPDKGVKPWPSRGADSGGSTQAPPTEMKPAKGVKPTGG